MTHAATSIAIHHASVFRQHVIGCDITALTMHARLREPPSDQCLICNPARSAPHVEPQYGSLVTSLRVFEFSEDILDEFLEHIHNLLGELRSCRRLGDEGLRGEGLAVIGLQRNPIGEDLVLTQNPLIMIVFGFSMFCFDWMYTTTCLGRLNIGLRPMRQIGLRPVRQTSSQTPTDMKNYFAWLAQTKVPMRSGSRKRSFVATTFPVSN